jgi:hypothetical protein
MVSKLSRIIISVSFTLILFIFSSTYTYAENHKGNICGIIADEQGFRISKAKIKVKDKRSSLEYEVFSNEDGLFIITNLPPSTYEIILEKEGFSPQTVSTIVQENITTLFDCSLKVSSIIDVIEVSPKNSKKLTKKEINSQLNYLTMRDNLASFLLDKQLPIYPTELLNNSIEGDLYIGVIVDTTGKVNKTFFLGGDLAFANSAMSAIEKWLFQKSEHGFFGYIGLKYKINRQNALQYDSVFLGEDVVLFNPFETPPPQTANRRSLNIPKKDTYLIIIVE